MPFLAALAATLTLGAQEVAAAVRRPDPPRHHHHRHHRRTPRFLTAIASWYDYAGASSGACGPLADNGVANRTLPCGTRLVMCAARCASAVVDDRGPYVPGRDFDLSLPLAERIGFDLNAGVGPVRWRFAVPEALWRE